MKPLSEKCSGSLMTAFGRLRPRFLYVALDKLTELEVDRRELFLHVNGLRNALEIALKIRRLR